MPGFLNRMTPPAFPMEPRGRDGLCAFVFRTHDLYLSPPPPNPPHALWSQGSLEQHQEASGFLLLPPAQALTEAAGLQPPVSQWRKHRGIIDVYLGFHTEVFHLHVSRTLPSGISHRGLFLCSASCLSACLPARMEESAREAFRW